MSQRGVFMHMSAIIDDMMGVPAIEQRWGSRMPHGF
jgi:hypothetical protein